MAIRQIISGLSLAVLLAGCARETEVPTVIREYPLSQTEVEQIFQNMEQGKYTNSIGREKTWTMTERFCRFLHLDNDDNIVANVYSPSAEER